MPPFGPYYIYELERMIKVKKIPYNNFKNFKNGKNSVNFTREPIVETVITPKEGFKLTIRNSRGSDLEEFSVDAVEVISFGNSYFFRNREKPKAFILPLSEYEVLETRENADDIKKIHKSKKTIKIGKTIKSGNSQERERKLNSNRA